jgi:hypothetical protein
MARKHVKPIQVHLPPGTEEQIKAHAKEQNLELSEYVRRLIEADMRAAGIEISLKVQRGGFREVKSP